MPFTHQDAVALLQQEPGHVMEGVAERHRLRVLELALDDGRPEPLPGKPLQDEQVVTFRVHLQEVHAVDVCVGQHIGKGRSEEHRSELQSLMRNSYDIFSLQQKTNDTTLTKTEQK